MSEERKYCVYCHTSPSGKVYIGMTGQRLERRWRKNGEGYKHCVYFWRAIQKYGWKNFKHEVLFDNLTANEACRVERLLIALFDTQNEEVGYNIGSGGDTPMLGQHLSEEHKQKISKSMIGKNAGENNYWYGKHLPEEIRKKMSESLTGRKMRPRTEEEREKIRQSAIKRFNGENGKAEREKLSNAMKGNKNALGVHRTQEAREKMSKSQLERFNGDRGLDERKKLSDSHKERYKNIVNNADANTVKEYKKRGRPKGLCLSEETRKKISDSKKKIAVVCVESGHIFASASAAAKELNLDRANIRACALNSNRTCGGCHWRYATEEEIKNAKNSSV